MTRVQRAWVAAALGLCAVAAAFAPWLLDEGCRETSALEGWLFLGGLLLFGVAAYFFVTRHDRRLLRGAVAGLGTIGVSFVLLYVLGVFLLYTTGNCEL